MGWSGGGKCSCKVSRRFERINPVLFPTFWRVMKDRDNQRIFEILADAKRLAKEYRTLTGRPLGITGEIAEFEAVRLLGLEMAPVRQAGYDAVHRSQLGEKRLQIKGRVIQGGLQSGARMGQIKLDREWDAVLLVLLDENLEAVEIFEADRITVTTALLAPGSRSRNERGALAISKFKSIGRRIWSRDGHHMFER